MASNQERPVVAKEFVVDHSDQQQFPSLPGSTTLIDHTVCALTSSAWSKKSRPWSKTRLDSTEIVEEMQEFSLGSTDASDQNAAGHAFSSTRTKDEKVPQVKEINICKSGDSVQHKDDDELQVTIFGEVEFDVQLQDGKVDNSSLHSDHQLCVYLPMDDANAHQNTKGLSQNELQDQGDASNQADEKNDLPSEDIFEGQADTKQKVADGQISGLAVAEKTDDLPTIRRPTQDSDIILMTDVVKNVLEKERVNHFSIKNSIKEEFVLDEQMFPPLSSVRTRTTGGI